jgi:hypothetical protein
VVPVWIGPGWTIVEHGAALRMGCRHVYTLLHAAGGLMADKTPKRPPKKKQPKKPK